MFYLNILVLGHDNEINNLSTLTFDNSYYSKDSSLVYKLAYQLTLCYKLRESMYSNNVYYKQRYSNYKRIRAKLSDCTNSQKALR